MDKEIVTQIFTDKIVDERPDSRPGFAILSNQSFRLESNLLLRGEKWLLHVNVDGTNKPLPAVFRSVVLLIEIHQCACHGFLICRQVRAAVDSKLSVDKRPDNGSATPWENFAQELSPFLYEAT